MSDDDIMSLNRGGHDSYKVYAAYVEATTQRFMNIKGPKRAL